MGLGAFQDNNFPSETSAESIFVYDPPNDAWMKGPMILANRRRGGGGVVVYQDKFYLAGEITNGHISGSVPWLDEFDPHTSSWKILHDAPRSRDHSHAIVVGERMYTVGGRRTSRWNTFGSTIEEVDVYDFTSGKWLTTGLPDDLPSPRPGAATAVFDGKIMLMGGESINQRDAYDELHGLDTTDGKWSTMPPMNHARHGTQAIVSGQGVYVAAGLPERGGGKQKNIEVYHKVVPFGVESTVGAFSVSNMTEISFGEPKSVTLENMAGNQGVFVQSISLSGQSAPDFVLTGDILYLLLIGQGTKLDVLVKYTGSTDGAKAQLDVTFSGHQRMSVKLVGWTLTIDSGADGEDVSIVSGKTWTFGVSSSVEIRGTDTPAIFHTHRSGRNFLYEIDALAPGGMYEVSLGFAEIYQPNCRKDARIMDISINVEGVQSDLDVYAAVGCKTALVETYPATANTKGRITIGVSAAKENVMVSKIHLVGIRDEPVPP